MNGMMVRLKDKVRRPISLKISAITLGFLVLMMLVTQASNWHLKKVNGELATLSTFYIPMDQTMVDLRTHHLAQILFFERFLASGAQLDFEATRLAAAKLIGELKNCERPNLSKASAALRKEFPAPGAREVAMYELMRVCGDKELDATRALVELGLSAATSADDAAQVQKFTKLQTELSRIPESRANLHAVIGKYLSELQQANKRSIEILKEQLETNRRAVGRETGSVLDVLDQYTLESATTAGALERRAFWFNWGITLGAAIFGALCAVMLTRNLVRPVRELLTGARAVEQGDLNIDIKVNSADEIALLAQSFNFMVTGLKEKEAIKETFGKYIDPRIVRGLLEKQPLSQVGDKRNMTVFFSDIEGFTTICEELSPDAVVRMLNHYFSVMSEPIQSNQGIIDKYIGDAIMAFWGPPFSGETDHAERGCYAALDQLAKLEKFRAGLPDIIGLRKGMPTFRVRVGLCTGDVIVGTIGSAVAKSYTVIGDTVNLASRLEATNKHFGTSVIMNEDTWAMAGHAIEARELDSIYVVGKNEPVRVFELLGRKGQVEENILQLRDRFEQGLQYYKARDWIAAMGCFQECVQLNPVDGPANLFISRLQYFNEHPPAKDWDGVWTLTEK